MTRPSRIAGRLAASLALLFATSLLPGCFVTRAVGLGPDPDPAEAMSGDPPDVLYAKGRALFEAKDWKRAEECFARVWKDHKGTPYAPDSRFYEAECRYAREKWSGAFELYKAFIKAQPLSPHAPLVERRLYDMGIYRIAEGERGFFDTSGDGVEMLEYLVTAFPNGDLADDSLIAVAEHDLRHHRPQDAVQNLHDLIDRYPSSEWAYEGRLRLARAYRALNRGDRYDADALRRSAAQYRAYLEIVGADRARAAEHADKLETARYELREVEESLARKGLEAADFYLYDGRTEAARAELRNVIKSWPESAAAAEARRRLGQDAGAGGDSNGGGAK